MAQYETDETGMSWPCGSIKAEALEVRALAESRNYSTLNPYLDQKQKVIVEAWFQLPTAAFCLSYLLFSWLAFDGIKPVFLAIYTSLFFGWLTTVMSKEIIESIVLLVILADNSIFFLALCAISAFSGNITWLSAAAIAIIHFLGALNPGHGISFTWARNKHPEMNPKYGAAKHLFNIKYPFEKYLSERSKLDDRTAADGSILFKIISLILLVSATIFLGK